MCNVLGNKLDEWAAMKMDEEKAMSKGHHDGACNIYC